MDSPADPGLRESDVDPDPIRQFQDWFDEAVATGAPLPEAMTLATASRKGEPSARMVLCKGIDARGFTFFTNSESQKGTDLDENPHAALVFYWSTLNRQVRIIGTVSRVTAAESDAYFRTRPIESQLSAASSPQSQVVTSRGALEAMVEQVRRRFGQRVTRPEVWGGFRLEPTSIEFWLHRDNRLHDRLRYRRQPEGGWHIERLAP